MTPPPERATPAVGKERMGAWLLALFVSLATALLIILPFSWLGTPSGHDIAFHAASWLEAAGQWRQGIIYPRWAEWADWGFGEPRFIFYPPLSWMLGAAAGLLAGWKAAIAVFVVAAQTIAGISMFTLARRTLPRPAALFAASCYAANPYALLVIYFRSDYAELLAAAIFPLLFLTLSDVLDPASASGHRPVAHRMSARVALFALVYALIWLCNAPAGVLASYTAALLIAYGAIRERSWKIPARGAGGLLLGLGLTSFYLVPAVYEQRWVNIEQVVSAGLTPSENFLYAVIDDPEHNHFNWIASTTAVGMIALTGLAALALRRDNLADQQRVTRQRLLLAAGAAAVLMPRISAPAWSLLPKLRFVQFPWRWMLVLAVPFAYFLGAMSRRRFGWLWILLIVAMLMATGAIFVHQAWWDRADMSTLRAGIAQGKGYEGTDEYDVQGGDHYDLPRGAPRVRALPPEGENAAALRSAEIRIERWTAESKVFEVNSREPVRVALRLVNYPAWQVDVNGAAVKPEYANGTAQMVVPLPAGTSRVRARFAHTMDLAIGAIISIASAILLAVLGCWPSLSGGPR